jgi:hypothetical protein
MGSPTLQTPQDPILPLPWLCFRGGNPCSHCLTWESSHDTACTVSSKVVSPAQSITHSDVLQTAVRLSRPPVLAAPAVLVDGANQHRDDVGTRRTLTYARAHGRAASTLSATVREAPAVAGGHMQGRRIGNRMRTTTCTTYLFAWRTAWRRRPLTNIIMGPSRVQVTVVALIAALSTVRMTLHPPHTPTPASGRTRTAAATACPGRGGVKRKRWCRAADWLRAGVYGRRGFGCRTQRRGRSKNGCCSDVRSLHIRPD